MAGKASLLSHLPVSLALSLSFFPGLPHSTICKWVTLPGQSRIPSLPPVVILDFPRGIPSHHFPKESAIRPSSVTFSLSPVDVQKIEALLSDAGESMSCRGAISEWGLFDGHAFERLREGKNIYIRNRNIMYKGPEVRNVLFIWGTVSGPAWFYQWVHTEDSRA